MGINTSRSPRANRTFRAKPNTDPHTKQWQLRKLAEATLGEGNLRNAVKLPEGGDLNEWIAHNTIDFYSHLNMLYGTIADFCTPQTCPTMNAGPQYEYLWQDTRSDQFKRPTRMCANNYIENLLEWVERLVTDEQLFPSKSGIEFPRSFNSTVKQILRRLFRIYAHIYCAHFAVVVAMGQEAHLNTSFKHFIYFVKEFDLIDKKDMEPIRELVEGI